MRKLLVTVVVLALALAATSVLAQTGQTGVIEGVVRTADGDAVADAVVTAAQADGSYPKSAVSDDRGRFRLPFLVPGLYNLVVSAEGFNNRQVVDIRVSAARSVRLEIDMPRTVVEEVEVVAAATLIDLSTNEYDTQIDSMEIEALPISRRATALINLTPGARENHVWGAATSQANAYQLDGVSVNQPGFGGSFLLPNVDWIEEFQVRGLGAGAEYGNFQGGLINIVTKSGTNTFDASVRMNYESESLNATNVNAAEAGEQPDKRWEINANVGGPLIRDKLYYFLSAQQTRSDTSVVDILNTTGSDVVFLPTMEERTETKLFAKLSWQATKDDMLHFVLGVDDVETDNRGLDSFTSPEAAEKQDSPANFWNLTWNRSLGQSNFLEVKVTGYDGEDKRLPLNGDIPAVQELGGDRFLFHNAIYTRVQKPDSQALAVKWDSYVSTGDVLHHLKIGGDYNKSGWDERRRRNGGYTWRPEIDDFGSFDDDDPSTWGFISSDWGGDINLDAENVNIALFIQDDMRVSDRLTITPGLRWGKWEGKLTPGDGSGTEFLAVEDDAIDPRLGIILDLTGQGRWVAKAHWGRYHQSMFALLYDRTIGGNVFSDLEYWDWFPPDPNQLPEVDRRYTEEERSELFDLYRVVPSSSEVGPVEDYNQPYLDQIVLGLEYAVTDDLKFGLTYINRTNEEIVALVDRNLESNFTEFRNVTVEYGDGRSAVLPSLWVANDDILYVGSAPGLTAGEVDALDWDPDYVLTNASDATRELDQVQLTADWRHANWSINASLVWSDLVGNFDSVSGYANSAGGTGVGGFVRINEQVNWYGRLPFSSEWEAKVRLYGDLPWGFRAGAYLRWFSGDAWTPYYEVDSRDTFISEGGEVFDPDLIYFIEEDEIFLEERGSREYEDQFTVDLHIDRPIQIGGASLVLGIDAFNLLNADAIIEGKERINGEETGDPTSLLGATRLRERPREIRISAALSW